MADHNQPDQKDRAKVRFPPPLVFAICMISAALIEAYVFPIGWAFPSLADYVGISVGVVGAILMVLSVGQFKKSGQRPEPWTTTPSLIDDGLYRFTRNPMYLGMALVQVAIGLGSGSLWVIGATPVSMALVWLIAIRHEEAYLETKFGDDYRRYKNRVRRWL